VSHGLAGWLPGSRGRSTVQEEEQRTSQQVTDLTGVSGERQPETRVGPRGGHPGKVQGNQRDPSWRCYWPPTHYVGAYPGAPIDLHLPYVPYARQDRVANPGESLSAKVFGGLINARGYRRVVFQDPHSDVTPALLDCVVIDHPLPALRRVVAAVLRENASLALVAPDAAGARKRVLKLASQFELPVVFADKVRDTRTGVITGHGDSKRVARLRAAQVLGMDRSTLPLLLKPYEKLPIPMITTLV